MTRKRETDGKFGITTFTKVKQYESAANDRSAFADICDAHGCDSYLFSTPAGFSKWDYARQSSYVVSLFNLQPAIIEMPVTVPVVA